MRGHVDAETLAAFREELLSRRKAGRVSAHLAGCPRCAALDAQLAEVTSMLTHASAPPMPDALTARIEAALAAEAAARSVTGTVPAGIPAAASSVTVPGVAAPGTGGRESGNGAADRTARRPARDRRWLALRVAAVTAAVAVVAGGGYGVAQLLSSGGATPLRSTAGGAAAPNMRKNPLAPRISNGTGGITAGGTGAGRSYHASLSEPALRVYSSGTNYQPGRLGAQARAALAAFSSAPRPVPSAAIPGNAPVFAFPHVPACVSHVAGRAQPLLVDVARYQGRPALIIVLPATANTKPRVLVIAEGCTATTAHTLTTAPLPTSP